MTNSEDPRLLATRNLALDAALTILQSEGVLSLTHATVSAATGISRSTLYRHWPKLEHLRNDAFKRVATPPSIAPRTNGPLKADLTWMLGILMSALTETPWGQVAPQVIAAAATDRDVKATINDLMAERIASVEAVFEAARTRGELGSDVPIRQLVEMAIAVPYFRKLIAGLPLDHDWLDTHVDMICRLAQGQKAPQGNLAAPDQA